MSNFAFAPKIYINLINLLFPALGEQYNRVLLILIMVCYLVVKRYRIKKQVAASLRRSGLFFPRENSEATFLYD